MKSNIKRIISGTLAATSAFVFIAAPNFGSNANLIEASAEDYEIAYFPGSVLQITQGAYKEYNAYSHDSQNAFDLGGNSNYVAPFTGKIVSINSTYNTVTFQSLDKVYFADGTLDYMTVSMTHDNDISDLKVGKVINQGTVFYQPGVKDPTGKTTGAHVHLAVHRGRTDSVFYSGNVYPNDALWLKKDTSIKQRGGYAWSSQGSATTLVNGSVYTIQPNGKNLYLSESGKNNFDPVKLSNTVNDSSKWRAHYTGGSWYFENLASGKMLDVYGDTVQAQKKVQVYEFDKYPTKYFILKPNGSGSFIIQTSNRRVAIDCKGSSSELANGTDVWTYNINYDSTQLFRFNEIIHEHEFGDWVVTTEPAAGKPGTETRTCRTCGATETRDIAPLPVPNPVNPDVTYVAHSSSADLNWNAVNGAERYAVAVKVNGNWSLVEKTTDTAYTLYGLNAGTTYEVAVIAMFGGEWYTDFSKAVKIIPTVTPVISVSDVTVRPGETGKITVKLDKNSGLISWRLKLDYDSDAIELTDFNVGDFEDASSGPLTSDPLTFSWCDSLNGNNKTNGTLATIGFKVKDTAKTGCYGITLSGDPEDFFDNDFNNVEVKLGSGKINVTDSPAPAPVPDPSKITYVSGKDYVKLSWDAVKGAERYGIAVYDNNEWKLVEKTTGTSYELRGLTAGNKYKVAIVSIYGNNLNTSFRNATVVEPILPVPVIESVDYNEEFHQFRLNWRAVDNAQAYGVGYYSAGKWRVYTDKLTAGTLGWTSPKLEPGMTFKVCVVAKVGGKWEIEAAVKSAVTVTIK